MIILINTIFLIFIISSFLKIKKTESFIYAFILILFYVFITTLFLDIFNELNINNLKYSWYFLTILNLFIIFYKKDFLYQLKLQGLKIFGFFKLIVKKLFEIIVEISPKRKYTINSKVNKLFDFRERGLKQFKINKKNLLLLLLFLIPSIILFFLAIYVSPNNWDSMTYHLPRIFHWLQNNNLDFYSTNIKRQLTYAPFSEIFMMHLYALHNSDKGFNFLQLFSYFLFFFVLINISKKLNLKNLSFYIFVLFFSLPEAILQSTSTQNNIFLGLLLIIIYFFLIKLLKKVNNLDLLIFSLMTSFSIYTKGTAYFFIFFPIITVFLKIIFDKKFKFLINFIFYLLFTFILINGLFIYRNYKYFKVIINPSKKPYILNNETISIKQFLSNLLRNSSTQLITNNQKMNNFIYKTNKFIHEKMNYSLNDPKTTWFGTQYNDQICPLYNEDCAPNPIHFSLFLISIIYFVLNFKKEKKELAIITFNLFLSFLLFSLALKWQPWHTRLILPILMLSILPTAYILKKIKIINYLIIILLIINSFNYYLKNTSKPLFGEENIFQKNNFQQYFINNKYIYPSYLKLKENININCNNYCLILEEDNYEYPLWILIKEKNKNAKINHCFVNNDSKFIKNKNINDNNYCLYIVTEERDKNLDLKNLIKKDLGYLKIYFY